MKAIDQYSHAVILCTAQGDFNFKSVDETLVCDHLNERFHVVLCIMLYKGVLSVTIRVPKLFSSTCMWFTTLHKVILNFMSVCDF